MEKRAGCLFERTADTHVYFSAIERESLTREGAFGSSRLEERATLPLLASPGQGVSDQVWK